MAIIVPSPGGSLGVAQIPKNNLPYWPLGSAITVANDNTDATNDIQFVANGKAVQCRDVDGNTAWVTPAAGTVIKRADATWVSGNDMGGMGSGLTFTASTEYYLFLITDGSSIDYGFDTSITAANLRTSTGWAYYRPVGWNKSTTGPAWRMFRRDGTWHWWRDQWAATSTVGGAVATVNVDAPTEFDCQTFFTVGSGHAALEKIISFWIGSTSESNPTSLVISWSVSSSAPSLLTTSHYTTDDVRVQRTNLTLFVIGGQIKTFGWDHNALAVSNASSWFSSDYYPNYLVRGFSLEGLIND